MQPQLFIAIKAIITFQGKVLLLREAATNPDGTNAGKFDVPGGRIHPGEPFLDALVREVREETGLSIIPGRPIHIGEWMPIVRGEQWHIVGVYIQCTTDTDKITLSEEHDAFEWIEPASIRNYNCMKSVYEAVRASGR